MADRKINHGDGIHNYKNLKICKVMKRQYKMQADLIALEKIKNKFTLYPIVLSPDTFL